MTNTGTAATITTARAATLAVKRAVRAAGLEIPTVRSYNAGCMGPASANVFAIGPEVLAALATIPGQTEIRENGSFTSVRPRPPRPAPERFRGRILV